MNSTGLGQMTTLQVRVHAAAAVFGRPFFRDNASA